MLGPAGQLCSILVHHEKSEGKPARFTHVFPVCTTVRLIVVFFIGWQAAGVPYPANGRPYTSGMRTTSQSVIKRQKVSQGEAPNPVVFVATKDTRYMAPQHSWVSNLFANWIVIVSEWMMNSCGIGVCSYHWSLWTRALRKHLTQSEMRRAARKPHLLVRIKLPPPPRSLPMPLLPSNTSEPIVLEDWKWGLRVVF